MVILSQPSLTNIQSLVTSNRTPRTPTSLTSPGQLQLTSCVLYLQNPTFLRYILIILYRSVILAEFFSVRGARLEVTRGCMSRAQYGRGSFDLLCADHTTRNHPRLHHYCHCRSHCHQAHHILSFQSARLSYPQPQPPLTNSPLAPLLTPAQPQHTQTIRSKASYSTN